MNTPRALMWALMGAGLASIALPSAALAKPHGHGHGHHAVVVAAPSTATLQVDNRFDGPAQVWLDRRLVGTVAGDAKLTLQTRPGMHQVQLVRAATGFVLTDERLWLENRSTTKLKVNAPLATLRVTNPSRTPLLVSACQTETWVQPGTAVDLTVEAGNVTLTATPRGEPRAHARTVWVEPGKRTLTTLDYTEPTRFIVYNHHPVSVRVLVDGVERTRVSAGGFAWIDTRPGTRQVTLLSGSRVIDSRSLRLDKGDSRSFVSTPPPPQSTRPGPPPRTVSFDDDIAICPVTGQPIRVASR